MKNLFTKLLAGLLVLLGFTSCEDLFTGTGPAEYGCPYTDYKVKGTVVSEDNEPIVGIRVVVSTWSNTTDTIYTDAEGKYSSKELYGSSPLGFEETDSIFFDDVDSTANGKFISKALPLSDYEATEVESDTDDNSLWYDGAYEVEVNVTLTEDDE